MKKLIVLHLEGCQHLRKVLAMDDANVVRDERNHIGIIVKLTAQINEQIVDEPSTMV